MGVLSGAGEEERLQGAPRCLFIRMSLENARIQDKELCRVASSPDKTAQAHSFGILETEAAAAPAEELIPSRGGHRYASYWLLRAGVDSQAFCYPYEELRIAATFCAADLQVYRNIQLPESELRTFDLASPANELVTGWWKGRRLCLDEFLASAGESDGASFTLDGLLRRAWGLDFHAKPVRFLQALKDMKDFPSILHLTAWKLEAWSVLPAGTQTAMSLGWIANYLCSSCRAFPQGCELRRSTGSSCSGEQEIEAKKRNLGKEGPGNAELNK